MKYIMKGALPCIALMGASLIVPAASADTACQNQTLTVNVTSELPTEGSDAQDVTVTEETAQSVGGKLEGPAFPYTLKPGTTGTWKIKGDIHNSGKLKIRRSLPLSDTDDGYGVYNFNPASTQNGLSYCVASASNKDSEYLDIKHKSSNENFSVTIRIDELNK